MKRNKQLFLQLALILIVSFAVLGLSPSFISAAEIDPQYVLVRKDGMSCKTIAKGGDPCRFLWNGDDPSKFNSEAMREIVDAIGTKGNDQRKLGVGVIFFYHMYNFERIKASLNNLLVNAQVHDFPVYLSLDGFQFWDGVPNLWNWWDPNLPGYNPANKQNVEWTGWSSSYAIKKSWRNWGEEFEVKPAPNISSTAFINSSQDRLKQLIPIIVNWYKALPEDKKYLLAGVELGNEIEIGINYYYYQNGVHPGDALPWQTNFTQYTKQIGYASVKTAGIKQVGALTTNDLNQAVQKYLITLNKLAYDLGIPRDRLFTHTGGKDVAPFTTTPANIVFNDAQAALNKYGNPGWSLYGENALDVSKNANINSVLNQMNYTPWAAPEWFPPLTTTSWFQTLKNSLNYRNNRLVGIANWENILNNQNVLKGIKDVLGETQSCRVTKPRLLPIHIDRNQIEISWEKGVNNQSVYLNISTSNDVTIQGSLNNVNVVNKNVSSIDHYKKADLNKGRYFVQLSVAGCQPIQARKSDILSFTIADRPGDINFDGKIDANDINLFITAFGKTGLSLAEDINNDGAVDIFDFNLLITSTLSS